MRRFVLLLAAATLFVPNNSNVVVAESNADDLIRLRFESTVSHVYDSHPSLQVGDKVHFELTVDPSNSVPDDGHSYLSGCEEFAVDPDFIFQAVSSTAGMCPEVRGSSRIFEMAKRFTQSQAMPTICSGLKAEGNTGATPTVFNLATAGTTSTSTPVLGLTM